MPTSVEAVASILLAIVPGYLAVATWSRARTWRGPAGDLRTVLESLAASAGIQLALAPLTIVWLYPHRDELERFPERLALWAVFAVLVAPVIAGLIAAAISNRRKQSTWPSIWDWLFTECAPNGRFLVVEFKDGERVAGAYASGAMAITSPERHGLYLCPEWVLDEDGEFVRELPGTAGIMIANVEEIRWVRVLDPGGNDVETR